MSQVIVRTISQLKELEQGDIIKSPNSRMEVSLYDIDSAKFSSRAYSYGNITADMNTVLSTSLTQQYNLSANYDLNSAYFPSDPKLRVNNVVERVAQLYNSGVTIDGQKTFTSIPLISKTASSYSTTNQQQVVNISKAQDMINNMGSFITPLSYTPYPLNEDEMPKSSYIEDSENLFIHIRYENSSDFTTTSFITQKTGWLTMWGWMASLGDVDPEKAWIALYGNVIVDKTTSPVTKADIPLQLWPWIAGESSKQLQYVGFSLPVKAGMILYVKSGFNVNIDAAAGFQNVRSKTYNTNQPGSFFGYILENT